MMEAITYTCERAILAAIPLMGCANDAQAQLNRAYVAPDGAGDGSSWAHAASINDLPDLAVSAKNRVDLARSSFGS